MSTIDDKILTALKALDTPTICNSLEVVNPDRRARGFNVKPFVCARPNLEPIVGYARTARIQSMHKPAKGMDAEGYFRYIAEGGPLPSVVVVEDIDELPGFGAFWGEVNTNVHYGLGCQGVITNGSIRDLPDSNPKFQMLAGMVNPSHGWVTVLDWGCNLNVHGMEVADGNLIHADQHGAVVIPVENAEAVIAEAKKIMARERVLIDAAQQPGFNMENLKQAWKGMAEIH